PSMIAMIAGALVLIAVLVIAARANKRGPIFAGLAVALVAFAPMSNVLAVNRWTADSYMYLPLAGVAIAAVAGVRRALASRVARVRAPRARRRGRRSCVRAARLGRDRRASHRSTRLCSKHDRQKLRHGLREDAR